MKLLVYPVLAALLAQFGSLPFLIGARSAGEAIGWPMIMAIFFGIPSAVVYVLMFGIFRVVMPPLWLAIALGIAVPAAVVIGFLTWRGMPLDLSSKNWVLWMGIIGGIAGTLTHLYLRGTGPSAS